MGARLDYNLQILKAIEQFITENPDQRFGQALYNLNIIRDVKPFDFEYLDRFIIAEESKDTFELLKKEPGDASGEDK